jgi:hypothetical protein
MIYGNMRPLCKLIALTLVGLAVITFGITRYSNPKGVDVM